MTPVIGKCLVVMMATVTMMSQASLLQASTSMSANPIRRVVNLLVAMQKKVTEEGEKEEALHNKFMCYCKNNGGALTKTIEDARDKIPELESAQQEAVSQKSQLEQDLEGHKADRTAAKAAIASAEQLREKEAGVYDAEMKEKRADIGSMQKAVGAMGGAGADSFLQSDVARSLRKTLSKGGESSFDDNRQEVLGFLSGSQSEYVPQTDEIIGILKQMKEEMQADVKDATKTENSAVTLAHDLVSAKKAELAASSKTIEQKLSRVGELAVQIATTADSLGDLQESLTADERMFADMDKNCGSEEANWENVQKNRSEELVALADTVKLLNDDDALDLFKKTLPSPSFMQMLVSSGALKSRALSFLRDARTSSRDRARLDFISLALRGKKIGMESVIKMVDELIGTLKTEQIDDDEKKVECSRQLDEADDKKKALERTGADLETVVANSEESVSTMAKEIAALVAGIEALDKTVAEATDIRKQEHAAHHSLMTSNHAAKELIGLAKNRMRKFYDPKLYKEAPKRDLTESERITVNMGETLAPTNAPGGIAGTGITAFMQVSAQAQQAPEGTGAFQKKSQESNGVLAMLDILVKDFDKELTVADVEEKDAQKHYEEAMADASAKRATDVKAVNDKQSAVAELKAQLEGAKEDRKSAAKEHSLTVAYIMSVHGECDFLLKFAGARKEARANEVDSLVKAKAVLSGADYSLLQLAQTRRFRRKA